MQIGEALVPLDEKPLLADFLRDYLAEMSAIIGGPPIHAYVFFGKYWTEPARRWPYWIRDGSANAGFALVRRSEDEGGFEMAEFFVASTFRRQGIGKAAARRIIARHPGGWRITQREVNAAAVTFWHGVLDGFVRYDETTTSTDAVRREQRFTTA